jgi:hypothetical protein
VSARVASEQLVAALRRGTTDYLERAAVDLLAGAVPRLLDREGVRRHIVIGPAWTPGESIAAFSWLGFAQEAMSGRLPLERVQRQVVQVALSLAATTPISLASALAGLDKDTAGAVLGAIRFVLKAGESE